MSAEGGRGMTVEAMFLDNEYICIVEGAIQEGRKCMNCGEVKPVEEFHFSNSRAGIRKTWCAVCCNRAVMEVQHRPESKAKRRDYLAKVRRDPKKLEKIREANRRANRKAYWKDRKPYVHLSEAAKLKRRREYAEREETLAMRRAYQRKYYLENKWRTRSISKTSAAVKSGEIAPAWGQDCYRCGGRSIEYEHFKPTYGEGYVVKPRCKKCRAEAQSKSRRAKL